MGTDITPVAATPVLDVTKPNVARVYEHLLGGKEAFAADREQARQMEELYPPIRALLRQNRDWLGRVVTWAARQGIGQFLDLGAGLPSSPAVHQVARRVNPAARVVYVDHDRINSGCAHSIDSSPT